MKYHKGFYAKYIAFNSKMMFIWNSLMDLIVEDIDNEDEILALLTKRASDMPMAIPQILNRPTTDSGMGSETMLMWAVWNLKPKVVAELLKWGADPHFSNAMQQSVATYWQWEKMAEYPGKVCDIVSLLHRHGVSFNTEIPDFTWSLVRKAREYKVLQVQELLTNLGYYV